MLAQKAAEFMSPDEFKKINEKYMALVRGRMDELEEKLIQIHAEYYTEEDIDALLVFYSTPVSKKLRQIQPELGRKCMEASQAFNEDLMKQMSAIASA